MDFLTDYDGIRDQLGAMNGQLTAMIDTNNTLTALINSLPAVSLNGAAMLSYVSYAQGVSQRLGLLLDHSELLVMVASRAVDEVEATDRSLMSRAPQMP